MPNNDTQHMKDRFGREITYMRLSITDLCNLRCQYCMPEEGVTKLRHDDILSVEEIAEITAAAAQLGITKVRITGGEPLVRRGVIEICEAVSATPGIRETCLTTNGILIPQYAQSLREAGVKRLNISLDSLNPDTYRSITRGGELSEALAGIDAAIAYGFNPIKVNAVLIGGVNDHDIVSLAALTIQGIHVRFIELMPIGGTSQWAGERFLNDSAVLSALPQLEPVGVDGVARTYRLPGIPGTVGLISPVSSHFCPSCNRIRVTSDGKLKPCLHSPEELNLRGLHGEELTAAMRSAILDKPQRHHLDSGYSRSSRSMTSTGG